MVYWSLFLLHYLYHYYLYWLTLTCRFPTKEHAFFCILNLAVQQSITMWNWSPGDALPSICSVKLVLIRRRWQNHWNHTTNEHCVVAFVASETSEHCTQHFSANKSHRFQDLKRSKGKWDIKAKQSALLSYKDLQRLCIFVNLSFALQTDSIVLKRSETQKLRFSNLHLLRFSHHRLKCFHLSFATPAPRRGRLFLSVVQRRLVLRVEALSSASVLDRKFLKYA